MMRRRLTHDARRQRRRRRRRRLGDDAITVEHFSANAIGRRARASGQSFLPLVRPSSSSSDSSSVSSTSSTSIPIRSSPSAPTSSVPQQSSNCLQSQGTHPCEDGPKIASSVSIFRWSPRSGRWGDHPAREVVVPRLMELAGRGRVAAHGCAFGPARVRKCRRKY